MTRRSLAGRSPAGTRFRSSPQRSLGAFVLVALVAMGAAQAHAQGVDGRSTRPGLILRGAGQIGSVVQHSRFIRGSNRDGAPIDRGRSWIGEIGWQTDGSRPWHAAYGYPTFGIGLLHADYGTDRELGEPTALYGWFGWPVLTRGRVRLSTDLALGVAVGWEPYDPEDNPANTAFSLPFSALLGTGLSAEVALADRWALRGGVGFTHFSNGALREPNVGLNQVNGNLGIQARLGDLSAARPDPTDGGSDGVGPSGAEGWGTFVRLGSGIRSVRFDREDSGQIDEFFGRSYGVVDALVIRELALGPRVRVGAGLGATWDNSSDERQRIAVSEGRPEAAGPASHLSVSLVGSWEQRFGPASAALRLGYTAFRDDWDGADPRFFQELGLSWVLSPSLSAGVDARFINASRSIFLDWGVGYRFGEL